MKFKKLIITIVSILFVCYLTVSALFYNASSSVTILCEKGSYAEKYAKENNVNCTLITDSQKDEYKLEHDNFEYYILDNQCVITAYNGSKEKIEIPEVIEGKTVVKIEAKAFDNCKNLKEIYVPDSVAVFEPTKLEGIVVYCSPESNTYATLKKAKNDSQNETTDKNGKSSNAIELKEYRKTETSKAPFEYNSVKGGIEIIKAENTNGTVIIPSAINDKSVVCVSISVLDDEIESIYIPSTVKQIKGEYSTPRYDMVFFANIGILLLMLIFAVLATIVAFKDSDALSKKFLGVSIIHTGWKHFIIALVLSAICLLCKANIIYQIVIAVLILTLGVIELVKAKMAVDYVSQIDEKIKTNTAFIKELTAEAQNLTNRAKAPMLKNLCTKVYEALRYSDPMSNENLADIEDRIKEEFATFTDAVLSDNLDLTESSANELINLINERNGKCKILK